MQLSLCCLKAAGKCLSRLGPICSRAVVVCAGAVVEPLLRPADVLRAVVLPAVRAGMAAHGLCGATKPDHSDGSAAPSSDAGPADLRLALQLGLDAIPAIGDERSTASKRGSLASGSAPQSQQSHLRSIASALATEGTAGELLRVLSALLDARPTAQPSTETTAANEPSAADRSNPPGRRTPLRLVEPAVELLQRLVTAHADLSNDVSEGRNPGGIPGSNPADSIPAADSLVQLRRRQLREVLVFARGCNWRTAIQLAPLEAAMSSLPASAAQTASELSNPAGSPANLAALLIPPLLRSSHSNMYTAEQAQHLINSRLTRSDTAEAAQAVTECLVLCASSAGAAAAFAEAARALTTPQQPAALTPAHQDVLPSQRQTTTQRHTTALAALALHLPRKIMRRALLAACLELLPWCTSVEYRQLTETVLPAWLATLQPRAASAAATPGAAKRAGSAAVSAGSARAASVRAEAASVGGSEAPSAGVLQLCARVASLLARDDAPVARDGSARRELSLHQCPWHVSPSWTPLRSSTVRFHTWISDHVCMTRKLDGG